MTRPPGSGRRKCGCSGCQYEQPARRDDRGPERVVAGVDQEHRHGHCLSNYFLDPPAGTKTIRSGTHVRVPRKVCLLYRGLSDKMTKISTEVVSSHLSQGWVKTPTQGVRASSRARRTLSRFLTAYFVSTTTSRGPRSISPTAARPRSRSRIGEGSFTCFVSFE